MTRQEGEQRNDDRMFHSWAFICFLCVFVAHVCACISASKINISKTLHLCWISLQW